MHTEAKVPEGTYKESFTLHLIRERAGILSNRGEPMAADASGTKRGTPVECLCIGFSLQGFGSRAGEELHEWLL